MLDLSQFVGMSKASGMAQIKKLGYYPKVIKENGKVYDPPLDYIPKLVNLTVRDDLITKAELDEIEF